MKKFISILTVLFLAVSMTASVYAQSDPEPGTEPDTGTDTTEYVIVNGRQFPPDWYKAYGFERDPRIDDPDWSLDEVGEWRNDIDTGFGLKDDGTTYRLSDGIPGQGEIEDIAIYWEENGYPDNVSYAFNGGGMLENDVIYDFWIIGIVSADDAARQAIIDLLAPTCLITFEDTTYSHKQRTEAYNGILALEDENIIDVIFVINLDRVLIIVSEENVGKYAEMLYTQFGGMVWVGDESFVGYKLDGDVLQGLIPKGEIGLEVAPIRPANPILPNSASPNPIILNPHLWIISALTVFLCLAAAIVFFRRARPARAMQTSNGNVVEKTNISEKQIVTAIKNSAKTPSDNVYQSIIAQIKSKQK